MTLDMDTLFKKIELTKDEIFSVVFGKTKQLQREKSLAEGELSFNPSV